MRAVSVTGEKRPWTAATDFAIALTNSDLRSTEPESEELLPSLVAGHVLVSAFDSIPSENQTTASAEQSVESAVIDLLIEDLAEELLWPVETSIATLIEPRP